MRQTLANTLVAPVFILLLFGSTLVGIDRLAFRDVSHFYTPLYDYVGWRTASQWMPLWNPLDQTGMPLLGETTTAVLYPVRYVLFRLPLASETALAWYVVLHLILASFTARAAARWHGVKPLEATIAGAIYSLGGSVLFLYSNPPFLVGAAWMPLALGCLTSRQGRSSMKVLVAATAMSMMILGGDPQTAMHAMIVACGVWLSRWTIRREKTCPVWVLIAAPLLAALLASPQLAASVSWSQQSERMRSEATPSWRDAPVVGGKRFESFEYSLAPWHALEIATPTPYGTLVGTHQRLCQLIPGDGRMWTPTIYLGVFGFLAIMLRVFDSTKRFIDLWFVVAIASLWLAMGHFGVVWLVQALTHSVSNWDSAVGGPYWWLYYFIPGYDSFRYPAKWLPVFALACSIIAAKVAELEHLSRELARLMKWVAGGLACAAGTILWLRWNPGTIVSPLAKLPSDEFWGPLNVDAALAQIQGSLIHSAVAFIVVAAILYRSNLGSWTRSRTMTCFLLLIAVDLGFCAQGIIHRVSIEDEQDLLATMESLPMDSQSRWMRTQADGGWPNRWQLVQDDGRLQDVEASGRAAWFGRWHLAHRAHVLNNMVSIQSQDSSWFWEASRRLTAKMTAKQQSNYWQAIRDWLSIDGVVHATSKSKLVDVGLRTASLVDSHVTKGSNAKYSVCYGRWELAEGSRAAGSSLQEMTRRLQALTDPDRDDVPVISGDGRTMLMLSDNTEQIEANVRQFQSFHDSTVLEVTTDHPTLVVIPVYQDGHWIAEYSSMDVEGGSNPTIVYRVDFLKQGVVLPAGQWRVQFRYAPWWLPWSLATAVISWVTVAFMWLRYRTNRLASNVDVPVPAADVSSSDHPVH